MARVFIALYNFGRKKDDFDAMPSFYESFVKGMKEAGNDVLCFHQKTHARSFDEPIPTQQAHIIKQFNPDICILFCNKFWDLSSIVDCPIIIYGVDSPWEYAGKENLRKNIDRYKFVISNSNSIDLLSDIYGVKSQNCFKIPYFTEVQADISVNQDVNISFLGTNWLWKGYDFLNSYIKKNASLVDKTNTAEILKAFTENPFEDSCTIKAKLGFSKNASSLDIPNDFRVGIEMSGLKRLKYLSSVADLGLEVRGDYWNIDGMIYFPEIAMRFNPKQTFTRKENEDFYNSSKLSLYTKNIQMQNGFSFRVFDIMASNACLVSEYCKDFAYLFPDINIPVFSTIIEAREVCKELLANEDMRLDIVKQCNEVINKSHRFKNVLEHIESLSEISLKSNVPGSLDIYSDENPESYDYILNKYVNNSLFTFAHVTQPPAAEPSLASKKQCNVSVKNLAKKTIGTFARFVRKVRDYFIVQVCWD